LGVKLPKRENKGKAEGGDSQLWGGKKPWGGVFVNQPKDRMWKNNGTWVAQTQRRGGGTPECGDQPPISGRASRRGPRWGGRKTWKKHNPIVKTESLPRTPFSHITANGKSGRMMRRKKSNSKSGTGRKTYMARKPHWWLLNGGGGGNRILQAPSGCKRQNRFDMGFGRGNEAGQRGSGCKRERVRKPCFGARRKGTVGGDCKMARVITTSFFAE